MAHDQNETRKKPAPQSKREREGAAHKIQHRGVESDQGERGQIRGRKHVGVYPLRGNELLAKEVMLKGVITFWDVETESGIIRGEDCEFFFNQRVITKGAPLEGATVIFCSDSDAMAHGIVVSPTFFQRLFPPTPDGLYAHYYYSSPPDVSERILSRSAFLRARLSKS